MNKHQSQWVRKYQLDDKPLISSKLAACEIQLHKQKETNMLACMKLCQNSASISLHKGVFGSKLIGNQRIIYGYLSSGSVSIVATIEQRTKIDAAVASGVFLIIAPLTQVVLEFKNSDELTVQKVEVPAFKGHCPGIIVRFKHLLHNLRLIPTSKHNVFLDN